MPGALEPDPPDLRRAFDRAHEERYGYADEDATFRRMWDFYLAYSQAGFATGYLDVAQLVDLHGGKVSCESEGEGHGSVFTVLLPTHESARTEVGA